MVKLITLLALLSIAGCSDVVTEKPQTDKAGISINLNYYKDGRVQNINELIDSVTYDNGELVVFASRVTVINKDSLINYIVK